jgi:outer membrane protein assembly factor BamB
MKLRYLFLMLILGLSSAALAKKHQELNLSAKAFKPKNQNILKTAWSLSLKNGGSQKRYYPQTSQPVAEGNMVYVGTHGSIFYAVDATSGRQIWKYENRGPIASTAAVTADAVIFSDLDGRLIALNKSSGTLLWKRHFNREILGQPLVMGSRVYVLVGERDVAALNVGDGKNSWQRVLDIYTRDITMHGQASFTTDGSRLFIGLADGHVYALSPGDGSVAWEQTLNLPLQSFKDIDADVVVSGDALYTVGYFGALDKLNRGSGGKIWQAEVASGVSPLVQDGRVYVSDVNGALTAFDADSGRELWNNDLNGSALSAPVAFGQYIVVGSFKNGIFVIDPSNGQQLQELSLGGSINRPAVVGDTLVFLTNGGKLLALRQK